MINEKILNKNQNYVVAVSGGPDSMFLLTWLVKLNYKNIFPVHINYNKRHDSHIDEKIFNDYCTVNKLNSYIKNVQKTEYKLIAHQYKNNNFQTIARIIRYNFFKQIAQEKNAKILTAHNLNDHVETFLLQKQRNNIVSYWGISEKVINNKENIEVIRPMLSIKKSTILKWLADNKINYASDYTNNLDIYKRNVIRKQLHDEQLDSFIKIIKFQNNQLLKEEKKLKKYYNIIVDEKNIIHLKFLYELKIEEQKKVIYQFFVNNNMPYLLNKKRKITEELLKQLHSKKPNIFFELSKNIFFIKEYNIAYLYEKNFLKSEMILINEFKNIEWNNYTIQFFKSKDSIDFDLINGYYCYLDMSDLPLKITNDKKYLKTIKIGSKTLNRFLMKEKISLLERNNSIFLSNQNKVLLIPKYKTVQNDKNKEYLLIIFKK